MCGAILRPSKGKEEKDMNNNVIGNSVYSLYADYLSFNKARVANHEEPVSFINYAFGRF